MRFAPSPEARAVYNAVATEFRGRGLYVGMKCLSLVTGILVWFDYTKKNILSTALLGLTAPSISHLSSIRTQTQFLQKKAGAG